MNVTLAAVFGDNMVLQRDMPVAVWGQASPGAKVAVSFGGQQVRTSAGADGKWSVKLQPMGASAKGEDLLVSASTSGAPEQTVVCRNVLIGEVWICSGQSNMEWPVALSNNALSEIAAADYPLIRLGAIPKRMEVEPQTDAPGALWEVCSPQTLGKASPAGYPFGFSGVAYYFGRELFRRLNVPIGLINASWGGSIGEAWTSREAFLSQASLADIWRKYADSLPTFPERIAAWEKNSSDTDARTRDTINLGYDRGYADVKEPSGEWDSMELPANWMNKGLVFNGIVWFRKAVEIPANWAGKDLRLSIGATDKNDVTYFNNVKVGSLTMKDRPDAWCCPRIYTVPGELVKAGRNLIAVRVHSNINDAGMIGPANIMNLSCPSVDHAPSISLAGDWRYCVEANYGKIKLPPRPEGPGTMNSPAMLFNGMIAPIIPFAARGVIWYQGEGNADRAKAYQTLFPTMIQDWRQRWGQEQLAFYFVQLANYSAARDEPGESAWAELREAQTMTLKLPATGMAVAIDIGDAGDIHPRNKQDVGLRLAYSALNQTYGLKDVAPSGPMLRNVEEVGDTLRVGFDHADGGLVCRGEKLAGFAIAGADRKFVWADARIDGQSVVLSSPKVKEPKFVRYGWADNPVCNLYNAAGLPASPFRTDQK